MYVSLTMNIMSTFVLHNIYPVIRNNVKTIFLIYIFFYFETMYRYIQIFVE